MTDEHAEVIRSEEETVLRPRRRAIGRVRLHRRIVSDEVLLRVTVRREELEVEHLSADGPVPDDAVWDDADGVRYRMVLHEEVPEVVMRTVPREAVSVIVTRQTAHTEVTVPLRHEEVVIDLPDGTTVPVPRETPRSPEEDHDG